MESTNLGETELMNAGTRRLEMWVATLIALAVAACSTRGGTPGADNPSAETTALSELSEATAEANAPGDPLVPALRAALLANQQAKLTAGDGGDFDELGISVAVYGDTALVGAAFDDDRGDNAGAAYVFVRNGATWVQQAKLTAGDGGPNDNFGVAVALSGDTAVIGSMFDDDAASDAGAAYVFVRSGSTWTQQAKLLANDGAADDQLGISVAIDGGTAVVGTVNDDDLGDRAGAAYVFVRGGTSWTQQSKLTAVDGVDADQFGISVAVSGDTAAVGAYGDDDRGRSSGSVYVFVRGGTSWSQQAKLLASDGADIDELGISVAISDNTLLAGAVFHADQGAAYVFVRSSTAWTEQARLIAADGGQGDNFGAAVALSGDTALIGAPNDNDLGAASGSAYVFSRSGTAWSQQGKHTASEGESVDLFGSSVALSGTTALISAIGDDDRATSAGAAYVFVDAPPLGGNGDVCTSGAQCGSGFCTDGVCCNTACGGGDPNDCQACSAAMGAAVNGTCVPRVASTVCRPANGACDLAEACDGSSTVCPVNAHAPATTVCRPASNSCDLVESCSGSADACPANAFKPDLSLCRGLLGLPGICLARTCVL